MNSNDPEIMKVFTVCLGIQGALLCHIDLQITNASSELGYNNYFQFIRWRLTLSCAEHFGYRPVSFCRNATPKSASLITPGTGLRGETIRMQEVY